MGKRLTMALAGLLLFTGQVLAQSKVAGTVLSAEDNEPVVGASVLVTGTTTGTVTDADGRFTITLPTGKTRVTIQYVGMKSMVLTAVDGMIVSLQSESKEIDEVVVTGYGVQRKASFTGAASLLNGNKIEKKSDANFVKSLEGAVTGVQMNNSSGAPGTWGSVYVRGRGSLNSGTQPLYVIDGVPVNSDQDALNKNTNNALDPMASINPNDIESVTVLKDAAATAIYGSRAGNGVIVIKTKSGSQGKFNVNLDVKQGFVTVANNNMEFADAEQTLQLYAAGRAARYKDKTQQEYYQELLKENGLKSVSNYNWFDAVTRKGYYQDYNLSVSGQTGNTGYYVSGGYMSSEGVVIGSDFKRYSGRANLNSKFKIFTFGANISYAYAIKNGASESTSGSLSNPIAAAITLMQPFYPFYGKNGNYANINRYNPLAINDKGLGDINKMETYTTTLSPFLQMDFGKGIYYKTTLGVNVYNLRQYEYWSAVYNPQGIDYNGLGQQYTSQRSTVTWNNILGWNRTFNQLHNISLMLGQELQRKSYLVDYIQGDNFPFASAGNRDLSTVGHWGDSQHQKEDARLVSYFGDAHYSYADRYYLSASFRRDGSSVFGSKHRFGSFWSVGGKWRFTDEDWLQLKDNKVINNGTLRISYGTVGNQDIDWYASRGLYTAGFNYHGLPGTRPTNLENPNLTWEVSRKFDVGFDLGLLNRLTLSFDYYDEKTTDALFEVPLSRTSGLQTTYQNLGSIRNQGIETALNATVMRTNEFNWTAYANLTWNRNRVLKLSTGDPIVGDYTIIKPGYAYRTFYMKEYAGVDRATGKPTWYLNESGDEVTTDYNAAARRYLGSPDPKVFGGFGTAVNWKGIDASIAFNYRLGAKVFDTGARFTGWGMSEYTPLKRVATDSWTADNPNAKYPQYITGDSNNATSYSSRFLMNGNFLRLSNISVGYTLPKALTRKAMMEKVRVYLSADNLYTWTAGDFVGYNPETYASGVIAWQYPASTTFVGGVQISF